MLDDVKNTPVTYPESKYPPDGKAPVAFGIPAWLCVPASASPTSAQFRKDLRHPKKSSFDRRLWAYKKFFRNWAPEDGNAGLANQAGLPAITATLQQYDGGFQKASGAISLSGRQQRTNSVQDWNCNVATFDASLCSSIYGRANTVMPASVNQPVILYLGRPT